VLGIELVIVDAAEPGPDHFGVTAGLPSLGRGQDLLNVFVKAGYVI
jgi:hypothetical protein